MYMYVRMFAHIHLKCLSHSSSSQVITYVLAHMA